MTHRPEPGMESDRPDYRHLRPPLAREVRWVVNDIPTWCAARLQVWAHRRLGEVAGPDGWWGYGEWTLPNGSIVRNWAHHSELRPGNGVAEQDSAQRGRSSRSAEGNHT